MTGFLTRKEEAEKLVARFLGRMGGPAWPARTPAHCLGNRKAARKGLNVKLAHAVLAAGFVLAAASANAEIPTTHILWKVVGEAPYNHLGEAVFSAGDVNGDGYPDVVAGAPDFQAISSSTGRGKVYVFSGVDGSTIYSWLGVNNNDQLGHSVGGGMDMDGDGVPDVVAGAPSGWPSADGKAYAYSGASGAMLYEILGPISSQFGASVAQIGDVDADGNADLVVGSPSETIVLGGEGRVHVFSGLTGSLLYLIDGGPLEALGIRVAPAGDISGDGKEDILIHARDYYGGDVGAVYLRSGADGSFMRKWNGTQYQENYGWGLDGRGDINQDGVPDILIGAPGWDSTWTNMGRMEVYSGSTFTILYTYYGWAASNQSYGWSVATVGDVNGDGNCEFLVGAINEGTVDAPDGATHLYSGATGNEIRKEMGDSFDNSLGWDVAAAEDIDQDGTLDIIVGAAEKQIGTNYELGCVYVLRVRPTVSEPSPGIAGQQNTFVATSATPNSSVTFYRSLMTNGRYAVGSCPGLWLEIADPVLMGSAQVDSTGTATISANIPGNYVGRNAFFYSVEQAACLTSLRRRFTFP